MTRTAPLRDVPGLASAGQAVLPVLVGKEIRALLVAWLACLMAILAFGTIGGGPFRGLPVAAYFFGTAALGALSIGHEYSHRTLAMLLSQPAPRQHLLFAKLAVLLAMLLLLSAAAAVALFNASDSRGAVLRREFGEAVLFLPLLWGLVVAPWLTMLCRNPIAGAVFAIGIPGMLWVAGQLLGIARYGAAPEADSVRLTFFWAAMLALCAVGAVMLPRTFRRLEAVDGSDPDVRLPAFALAPFAALRRGRRHPVWMLVRKELHLQQIAFVVAGLYMLGSAPILVAGAFAADLMDDVLTLLTIFYPFLISLVIGALASAGERQLGTLEWQMILPVSTSKQWAIKVAMTLGLTMTVGMGLPVLVLSIGAAMQSAIYTGPDIVQLTPAVLIILCTAGALYVSSLCASGIQALLVSVAAMPAMAFFIQTVLGPLGSTVFLWAHGVSRPFTKPGLRLGDTGFATALALLLIAGFVAVMLRFALANHRSAERTAGRVWKQVMWLAACLTIGVTLWAGLAGSLV